MTDQLAIADRAPAAPKMTEARILDLLAEKHARDVFVPQCKDGPTHGASHRKLDAWAMPRSWVDLRFIGYEIKVSRSDWIGDHKIADYLALCTDLYVVAPAGIVQAEELPQGVGLMEPSKAGRRLFTRRKAAYRDVAPPVELFAYILMCRAQISRHELGLSKEERIDQYRRFVNDEDARRQLGQQVSHKLRSLIRDKVAAAETRAMLAEQRAGNLESCADVLRQLGITPENASSWRLRQRLTDDCGLTDVRRAIASLEAVARRLCGEE